MTAATSANPFPVSCLVVVSETEPRIPDLRIGQALGMAQPLNIRQTIQKNSEELQTYGPIHVEREMVQIGSGARRETTAYWLLEPQALLVCMLSRAPNAPQVRRALIEVFMAWRRGERPAAFDRPPLTLDDVAAAVGDRVRVSLPEVIDRLGCADDRRTVTTIGRHMAHLGFVVDRRRSPQSGDRVRYYSQMVTAAAFNAHKLAYEKLLVDLREVSRGLTEALDGALDIHYRT